MQQPLRQTPPPARETPPHATGEAPIAAPFWAGWARDIAITAAAGVFLALVGAFQSGQAPLWARLAFWVPAMTGAGLIAIVVMSNLARVEAVRTNTLLYGALGVAAMTPLISVFIWLYAGWLWGIGHRIEDLSDYLFGVFVVSSAMTAIGFSIDRPGRVTHAAPAPNLAAPRFLVRLPPKLRGATLHALQAEDHYLRLHTSKGSDLILMRLSDAISELDGVEGAQTHRSWWVARDAVEAARRADGRVVLVLKGGIEAPVSRPNVRPLREARWF